MADASKIAPIFISVLALGATIYNVVVANSSYRLNKEVQKAAIFSQFEQQYNSIASKFPSQLLDQNFHPTPGTDDYRKLEDYWIFCYAEWYETQKSQPDLFSDLWDNYYSGLIQNALETPSLRSVISQMFTTYGVKRSDMQEFYKSIHTLADKAGEPFVPNSTKPASPH